MLLKLFGLGVATYVADSMNIFDGAIVFSSLVELALGGGGMLSVLRSEHHTNAFTEQCMLKDVSIAAYFQTDALHPITAAADDCDGRFSRRGFKFLFDPLLVHVY